MYDVALSFAGEDRAFVQEVAAWLKAAGIRVFYDEYEQVALWGKDLYVHLDEIYRNASKYCVIFISEHYAAKLWTSHERKSAQARAFSENSEYILPFRLDNTEIPGILATIGYLDSNGISATELAKLIAKKLGPVELTPGMPGKPDRLWRSLKVKTKAEKKRTSNIAENFYGALTRMSIDERRTVLGVFAFGCVAELPAHVHISLDYLRRVTGIPAESILKNLAAVRSLSFKARIDKIVQGHAPGELAADDFDVKLSFWAPGSIHNDASRVAYWAVQNAVDHFCEDHGLEIVTRLDFHYLSSSRRRGEGLVIPDESDHGKRN